MSVVLVGNLPCVDRSVLLLNHRLDTGAEAIDYEGMTAVAPVNHGFRNFVRRLDSSWITPQPRVNECHMPQVAAPPFKAVDLLVHVLPLT
jgi:hypothetical protein